MPVSNHYEWSLSESLPELARHSEVKHSLLRSYLVDYFLTLVRTPAQEIVKLTIVDGFCGGGRYINEKFGKEVPGSPVVILQAIEEAKARVLHDQQRRKDIDFRVTLICIDKSQSTIDHLVWVLEQEGYGSKLSDGSIQTLVGEFDQYAGSVISEVQRLSPKSGRSLFILDQYGYNQVPVKTLNQIFTRLKQPEVILTFNVDSLINFLSTRNLRSFERRTGLIDAVSALHLDKESRGPGWRKEVQAGLYQSLTAGSGARYFTPFFMRPDKGHGDFWLLHLSQHWKARDVMAQTHWQHHNHFVHYGAAGFDMFSTGYAARIDDDDKPQSAFEFDDLARNSSHSIMMEQIPRALETHRGGITLQDFFLERVNTTPATHAMLKEAALELVREGEIEVLGENGCISRVSKNLKSEHILRLPDQRPFVFMR